MKKCPYCGHVVEDDIVHCPKCLAGIPHEAENKKEESGEAEPEGIRRKRISKDK